MTADPDFRQGEDPRARTRVDAVVDRHDNWLDHSSRREGLAMVWYDKFGKYRNPAVDRRARDRAARPRARLRRSRSTQDRAPCGRHAERLHAAERGAYALPDGVHHRTQYQPAGAGDTRHWRHRRVDQDHLYA